MTYDKEQLEILAQAEAEWEEQEKENQVEKKLRNLLPYHDDLN
jgi:hypothetical protein